MLLVDNRNQLLFPEFRIKFYNAWAHNISSAGNKLYRTHVNDDLFQERALQQQLQSWYYFAFLIKETRLIVLKHIQLMVGFSKHQLVFFAKKILNAKLLRNFLINLLDIRLGELLFHDRAFLDKIFKSLQFFTLHDRAI
jgi:hypothetical protein